MSYFIIPREKIAIGNIEAELMFKYVQYVNYFLRIFKLDVAPMQYWELEG